MKYEFWTYEELEVKLRELHENHPEFGVSIRRVMDGGRFFVTVEQDIEDEENEYPSKALLRTIDEWHEDYGDVLWWKFPIEEPPYCGTPLDDSWPDYHTHWTPIALPEQPE